MRSPIVIALGMLLVGCGIDRGGAPDMSIGPANSFRPVESLIVGPIDDKSANTLTIGGVTIDVDNTLIQVDGGASALDLLQVGQYAVVRGSSAPGFAVQASSINVDTEVIGPATAFDPINNALILLGQQVIISDDTTLDSVLVDAVFSDIESLGTIRVSGIADGLGRIYATYMAPEPVEPSRLTGFATVIDDVNLNFFIGQQTITYANAIVVDLASSAPVENARVTLTGETQATSFTVNTIVDAPLVPDDLPSNALIQLTAAVTLPLTDGSFAAGFVPATLTADVTFTDGISSDIVPGAIVTVQGFWHDDQRIDVTAIRIVRRQITTGTK